MSAAISQVGPPETKHPPVASPPAPAGNVVPPSPPPPFKTVWTVTLPTASRVSLCAGTTNFFVGTDAGPLMAYTLDAAKEAWTANLKPDVDLITGDDLVFVAQGDTLHALDQATGKEHWAVATGPLATTPTWRTGWLFTSSKDGTIAAWRASDGSKVWQQAVGSPASAPLAVDGVLLFVPLADRRLVAMKIPEDGTPEWTLTLKGVGGQPLAAAGRVYVGTSEYQFYSIKQDGGSLEWSHRLIHSTVVGHPILDERHIYVATNDNRLLALSRGNGEIDWMPTLTSRPAPQVVVDSGQVIVPLVSGDLAVFSQKDGKVVASPPASTGASAPTTEPAVPAGSAPAAAGVTPAPTSAAASAPASGATPPAAAPVPPTAPASAPAPPAAPAQTAPPPAQPPGPPAPASPAIPGLGPGATVVTGTPRGSEGIRLAAPLVLAGSPEAAELLRVTLGADTVHTVTAFRRDQKPAKPGETAKD